MIIILNQNECTFLNTTMSLCFIEAKGVQIFNMLVFSHWLQYAAQLQFS